MARKIIPVGTVFGKLTVVGAGEPQLNRVGRSESTSMCNCECGNSSVVKNYKLRWGDKNSCGCLHRPHGQSANSRTGAVCTGEYKSWQHMKERCTKSECKDYVNYGGRGITVCDRWAGSFNAFFEDMGPKPSPRHSIDRIDNNGNYEPGNVRWATRVEQSNNRRRCVNLTFYGKTMNISQWSKISQVRNGLISERIKSGWPAKEAVWTQVKLRNAK